MAEELTAAQLAERLEGRLVGAADAVVAGVASLTEASAADVSFLGNPKYRDQVLPSQAAVVLVPEDFAPEPPDGRAWIHCANPSASFAHVVAAFAPPPVEYAPGIDPTAVVAASVQVAESAHIGANAVVAEGVVIGDRSVIGAGTVVGAEARLGADCLIHANVTIRERCLLGSRVIVHSGTVIGSDGFGYLPGPTGHTKIPQVGIVQIDDDVELGALVAVDRARFGKTWIKRGAKIDNLVQIAHNVVIGEHCFIIAQVGISGSSRIGTGAALGGQVGVAGHLTIGDGVQAAAKAGISKDIPPGSTVIGQPAVDKKRFLKQQVLLKRLERFQNAVRDLQREVEQIRDRLDECD